MLALKPTAPWARAAKRIRADGAIEPYMLGREFVGAETNWTTAREAFDGLERLRGEVSICLIRGALLPDAPSPFPRRYRGELRAIAPCARRLLGVDFDKGLSPNDRVDAVAREAIGKLPATLQAGPIRAQLTASATPEAPRVRLWLWLDQPAGDRSARTALHGVSDCSLYSPVQPHYTADAIRETPDPWRERVWECELPGVASLGSVDDLSAQATELLTIWPKRIKRAKEGDRHKIVNAAAYDLGRYIGAGLASRDVVRDTLIAAAVEARLPLERATDEVDRAIDDGTRKPVTDEAWRARLARTSDGAIKACATNALAIVTNDPRWADRVALDVTTGQPTWVDPPAWAKHGPIAKAEHLLVAQAIERDHRVTLGADAVGAAIETAAHLAPVDPLREWLDDQPWDGVARVDTALTDLLGAESSDYVRGSSRAFFLSLAARILRPGCQVDLALVLCGDQGCGKTSFLRDVGGDWYAELADLQSEDAVYVLARAALVELGELAALNRSDLERVKGFLSRTSDTYRRKYAAEAVTVPRRSIFAGTTNLAGFLIDPTGDRRFLPVAVRRYDRQLARDVIPLLLGEARERVLAGEAWHDVPGAVEAQAAQHTPDPWVDAIAPVVGGRDRVTIRDVATGMGLALERQTQATSRRIAQALRSLGWRETRENGVRAWTR